MQIESGDQAQRPSQRTKKRHIIYEDGVKVMPIVHCKFAKCVKLCALER